MVAPLHLPYTPCPSCGCAGGCAVLAAGLAAGVAAGLADGLAAGLAAGKSWLTIAGAGWRCLALARHALATPR